MTQLNDNTNGSAMARSYVTIERERGGTASYEGKH